jgi:hypothetical protein
VGAPTHTTAIPDGKTGHHPNLQLKQQKNFASLLAEP